MTSVSAIAAFCRRLLFAALLATASLPAFAEDLSQCMKGWALTESDDYPGALALYEACIRDGQLSDASLARTYRNIGNNQRRAGEPLKAVAAYDHGVRSQALYERFVAHGLLDHAK